jgi:hypoxanthine phosphoribosyltransferase
MKKIYYSWDLVERMCLTIGREILLTQQMPDLIVGITRGGLVPANLLSQFLGCKMDTLDISFRDGYTNPTSSLPDWFISAAKHTNVLVVDDINDSGRTLSYIQNQCHNMPKLRYATLVENEGSIFKDVSHSASLIDKREDDTWIEFPWENWWASKR